MDCAHAPFESSAKKNSRRRKRLREPCEFVTRMSSFASVHLATCEGRTERDRKIHTDPLIDQPAIHSRAGGRSQILTFFLSYLAHPLPTRAALRSPWPQAHSPKTVSRWHRT